MKNLMQRVIWRVVDSVKMKQPLSIAGELGVPKERTSSRDHMTIFSKDM